MGIEEVAEIIHRISDGFEGCVAQCLSDNKGVIVQEIKEQLYSGLNGNDEHLSPTYDNDPYFNEEGYWHHRAAAYKAWKKKITPPVSGTMIGLAARPDDVPNLFIDGTFYSGITARMQGNALEVSAGSDSGPDIVRKYGEIILMPGPTAIDYFNLYHLIPAIEEFLRNCGYR